MTRKKEDFSKQCHLATLDILQTLDKYKINYDDAVIIFDIILSDFQEVNEKEDEQTKTEQKENESKTYN